MPSNRKEYSREYARRNAVKHRERSKEWARNNPEKVRVRSLRRYGITPEQYEEMLLKQNGCCKICEKCCPSGRRLAVDHCHKTGKVRGLLCMWCNTTLGKVKDRIDILKTLINYLDNFK